MGNRSRKKQAAAEFNAKRTAEIERIERDRAEYEAWAATPEGQAAIERRRRGGRRSSAMFMAAAMTIGGFR